MRKHGITKREREVTDLGEILEILDKSMVVHIAMVDGDEPYLVPMNYGYTMEDGKLTLYVHGAVKGRKTDVLRVNPTHRADVLDVLASGQLTDEAAAIIEKVAKEIVEGLA